MLAPGCQSMSIRTKLSHSGPSITTMTGLVVAKAKGLAPVGSNCQSLGFSTRLDCRHTTAEGISEKWWEITTWTSWSESHCTLFWQLVRCSSPSGNWTAILIGIPVLGLCYQQVSFLPTSTSHQEHLFSILNIFLGENSAYTGCATAPEMCVQPVTTVNTSDQGHFTFIRIIWSWHLGTQTRS